MTLRWESSGKTECAQGVGHRDLREATDATLQQVIRVERSCRDRLRLCGDSCDEDVAPAVTIHLRDLSVQHHPNRRSRERRSQVATFEDRRGKGRADQNRLRFAPDQAAERRDRVLNSCHSQRRTESGPGRRPAAPIVTRAHLVGEEAEELQ